MNPPYFMDLPSIDTMVPTFILQVNSNPYQGGKKTWNPSLKGKPPFSKLNRVWTHYGRTNHAVYTYFVEHEYPPGFKKNPKNASSANNVSDQAHATSIIPSFYFTQERYNNIIEVL